MIHYMMQTRELDADRGCFVLFAKEKAMEEADAEIATARTMNAVQEEDAEFRAAAAAVPFNGEAELRSLKNRVRRNIILPQVLRTEWGSLHREKKHEKIASPSPRAPMSRKRAAI